MARRPRSAQGTLVKSPNGWQIELEPGSLSGAEMAEPVADDTGGLETGTHVRVLFWSDAPDGQPSELEAISDRQQLDVSIVAHALEAEGSLSQDREEFLNRLSQIEQ
jgi:hypothetical protein